MVKKQKKDSNITKLEVVKDKDYYGFERRGESEARRKKDSVVDEIRNAMKTNEDEIRKQFEASESEKEQALAKIEELEAEKKALTIPFDESVLYYGVTFTSFIILAIWGSLIIYTKI